MKEQNKKKEEKIKELQDFIARFSANASKSKQATSRKKSLEKIELEEIKASNRKYPYIDFKPERMPGNEILKVKNISKTINGEKVLDNISFNVRPGNKIAVVSDNELRTTLLFQIIAGEVEPDEGEIEWGQTITNAYFPKDKVLGLSKIARIADMVARRLQLQERIGTDIASIMTKVTGSEDVAVVIEGCHSCVTSRGIKKNSSKTVTTTFLGKFKDDVLLQNQLLIHLR